MIDLNNKFVLNLEQQVQYLTNQIEMLKQVNLKGYINIVGNVNNIEDLPEDYTGNIGDFYLVIQDPPEPNDLYMWGNTGEDVPGWVYCGPFPLQGPSGANGSQGPKGDTGSSTKWFSGIQFPVSATEGDMFLNTQTCNVFRYTSGSWILQCNIKGIAGTDGLNGNSILSITSSHSDAQARTTVTITTSKGGSITFYIPDGQPGVGFRIAHIWPEDEEDIPATLPADIVDTLEELWPAEEATTADAILVKTLNEGDFLFVILTEDGVQTWDEAGQIQSVQGPAGADGTIIQTSEQITVQSVGDNTNQLIINALPYLTVAPTANYTPIGNCLKLVVLDAEPATYYSGYYYIITEA